MVTNTTMRANARGGVYEERTDISGPARIFLFSPQVASYERLQPCGESRRGDHGLADTARRNVTGTDL